MTYSKLRFSRFKKFVSRSIFGKPQLADIIEFSNLLLGLKNQRYGSKTVYGFSIILIWKNYDVLKSKNHFFFLLNKNINFNKYEMESKMENPHTFLERRTSCFSSYKNRELKVKLWWVGAREKATSIIFVTFIFPEGNFFLTFAFYRNV